MKFCKYCGRELVRRENCSCRESIGNKFTLSKKQIQVGIVITGIFAFAVLIVIGVLRHRASDSPTTDTSTTTVEETTRTPAFETLEEKETANNSDTIAGESVTAPVELIEIDILSMFEIGNDGEISGQANVIITPKSDEEYLLLDGLTVSQEHNVSSGQEITVTLTNEYIALLAEQHYIVPTEISRKYVVGPLRSYVTSAGQIPQEILWDYAQQYCSEVEKTTEEDYIFTYDNFRLHCVYWMTKKDDVWTTLDGDTRLVIVVAFDEYQYGNFNEQEYKALVFTDLLRAADGTVTMNYDAGKSDFFDYNRHAEAYVIDEINLPG